MTSAIPVWRALVTAMVSFLPFLSCAQGTHDTVSCVSSEVLRTTAIAAGATHRLDTYLSPQSYTGTTVRFLSSVLRSRTSLWDVQLNHEGSVDITHNPVDNADAISGHYDFAFAMMKRWEMADGRLTLRAGGMTSLYLGFAYNTRNYANNPAQGYASWNVGCAGMAVYRLRIGKWNIPLTYELRLPLAGVMFSPAYGQSYYELFYGGKYDDNVVFTNVSVPSLRQQLSIDLPIWRRVSLRIGYLGDIRQAKPNHLKQHEYSHAFVIGATRRM